MDCSWLYLSRLAAMKEHAFMVALGEHGLPVPYAVAHNRHCVLMTMVDAVPLVQVLLFLDSLLLLFFFLLLTSTMGHCVLMTMVDAVPFVQALLFLVLLFFLLLLLLFSLLLLFC